MKKELELMGHIVAGYPNLHASKNAALGIIDAKARYLEVQFPFSDPSADGIIIQEANQKALEGGFEIHQGFDLVAQLSSQTQTIIMSYANILFSYGIEDFIKKAKACGAWGIIVPDLPLGEDEGLRKIARKHRIFVIELITPNMPIHRMKELVSQSRCELLYIVARSGITGAQTDINSHVLEYIKTIRSLSHGKKLALGFGINSCKQVQALQGKVEVVVAGSYFVQEIKKDPSTEHLRRAALKLMGEI